MRQAIWSSNLGRGIFNQSFFFRTSFLPSEILWGHRFETMLLYRKDNNKFLINFSAFNSTYEVDTPLWSAKMLDDLFLNSHARKSAPYFLGLKTPIHHGVLEKDLNIWKPDTIIYQSNRGHRKQKTKWDRLWRPHSPRKDHAYWTWIRVLTR